MKHDAFVPIGGIDQWVTISGDRCDNSVVLFLHGGPGNPLSPYSESLHRNWESDFTIVHWDQRGAGRTFGRNPSTAQGSLTIDRMTKDGLELAEYLTAALGTDKVYLVGGSWGSVLGVHMAKARPGLFHAYVGVGQLVSYRQNQAASYRQVLSLARAAGDAATVAKIEALGPPPWTDPRAFGILRRATRVYEAKATVAAPDGWWVPRERYASSDARAEYEAAEDYSYLQFVGRSGNGMFSTLELSKLGQRFELPVYLVQGSEDLVTMPEVAKRYFDALTAPRKRYVLLKQTGHDPNQRTLDAILAILRTETAMQAGSAAR